MQIDYNPDELARECNKILALMKQMTEEERKEYVNEVLEWFDDKYKQMMGELRQLSKMNKIAQMKKGMEIMKKYKEIFKRRRAELIVVLTYAIKEEYQQKLAPIIISMLQLV